MSVGSVQVTDVIELRPGTNVLAHCMVPTENTADTIKGLFAGVDKPEPDQRVGRFLPPEVFGESEKVRALYIVSLIVREHCT